jgi:hypothetical protein
MAPQAATTTRLGRARNAPQSSLRSRATAAPVASGTALPDARSTPPNYPRAVPAPGSCAAHIPPALLPSPCRCPCLGARSCLQTSRGSVVRKTRASSSALHYAIGGKVVAHLDSSASISLAAFRISWSRGPLYVLKPCSRLLRIIFRMFPGLAHSVTEITFIVSWTRYTFSDGFGWISKSEQLCS